MSHGNVPLSPEEIRAIAAALADELERRAMLPSHIPLRRGSQGDSCRNENQENVSMWNDTETSTESESVEAMADQLLERLEALPPPRSSRKRSGES